MSCDTTYVVKGPACFCRQNTQFRRQGRRLDTRVLVNAEQSAFRSRGHGLICSMCWSLCYKTCYHGPFQATNMMLLNMNLGRHAHVWLSQTSTSCSITPQTTRGRGRDNSRETSQEATVRIRIRETKCVDQGGNSRDVKVVRYTTL